MRDLDLVSVYHRLTGIKQEVPREWLALYPDLAVTPSVRAKPPAAAPTPPIGAVSAARRRSEVVPAEQIKRIAPPLGAINARRTTAPVIPQTPPSAADRTTPTTSGTAAPSKEN